MRYLLLILGVTALLTGCGTPPPYTQQDLSDVHRVYAVLAPLYQDFVTAYLAGNGAELRKDYEREQQECRIVDRIDQRDTIDPNIYLFLASDGLDHFCNDIEYVYAYWKKEHGLPYNKDMIPARPDDVLQDGILMIQKEHKYLRHPTTLT